MSRRRPRVRAAPAAVAPLPVAGDVGFVGTIREPFSGAWQMNKECTPQTALAFSGVYACVTTIADDVSKMSMTVKEIDDAGIVRDLPEHWLVRLFRRPNPFQTGLQFLQQYAVCKLLTGNVYVVFLYDERRVPVAMYVIDPRTCTPYITDDGDVYYQINLTRGNGNALARLVGDSPMLPASQVLHDRMNTAFHPLIGISPLFAAGPSAQTGLAIVNGSKSFFGNMSRASGVLTAPGKVSKETAERLATKWKANFSAGNAGNVAVLGDGLKWEPLSMTAADAQLIEQLRWSVEDIARVFRVPLFMLGDLTKVSYRNSEQLARTYYQSTLQWHLESIELAFDKFFQFSRRIYSEFDLDSLFRTDSETRYKNYQIALASGWISINEVRAKENLPPIKGGDEPRIQMQYVPLSKADEPPPEPVPVEPEEEEETPEEETEDETDVEETAEAAFWASVTREIEGVTYENA